MKRTGGTTRALRMRIGICAALVVALLGVTTQVGAVGRPPAKKALISVTYGISSQTLTVLPQYWALAKGFYRKHGLNVTLDPINNGPATIAAVISGSAQFAVTSIFQIWGYIEQGAPLLAVAEEIKGYQSELCLTPNVAAARGITPKTDPATMLRDLHGLIIGALSPGTVTALLVNGLLKTYGVPTSTFTQGNNNSTATDSLMAAGTINGAFATSPVCEIAEAGGYGKSVWQLASLKAFSQIAYGLTFTTTNYAKQHPQIVSDMVGALNDMQKYIRTHLQEAAKFAESQFAAPPATALQSVINTGYAPTTEITAVGIRNAQQAANSFDLTVNKVSPAIAQIAYTNRFYNYGSSNAAP